MQDLDRPRSKTNRRTIGHQKHTTAAAAAQATTDNTKVPSCSQNQIPIAYSRCLRIYLIFSSVITETNKDKKILPREDIQMLLSHAKVNINLNAVFRFINVLGIPDNFNPPISGSPQDLKPILLSCSRPIITSCLQPTHIALKLSLSCGNICTTNACALIKFMSSHFKFEV